MYELLNLFLAGIFELGKEWKSCLVTRTEIAGRRCPLFEVARRSKLPIRPHPTPKLHHRDQMNQGHVPMTSWGHVQIHHSFVQWLIQVQGSRDEYSPTTDYLHQQICSTEARHIRLPASICCSALIQAVLYKLASTGRGRDIGFNFVKWRPLALAVEHVLGRIAF